MSQTVERESRPIERIGRNKLIPETVLLLIGGAVSVFLMPLLASACQRAGGDLLEA